MCRTIDDFFWYALMCAWFYFSEALGIEHTNMIPKKKQKMKKNNNEIKKLYHKHLPNKQQQKLIWNDKRKWKNKRKENKVYVKPIFFAQIYLPIILTGWTEHYENHQIL